jgi:hypothetical protein
LEVGWLAALVGLCWASAGALAQPAPRPSSAAPARLSLDELSPQVRERIRRILEQPTISARAPAEDFDGRPALYHWLLDHPDRAAQAWHRLGTPCLDITDRGHGRFGWADDQGSDLYWEVIHDTPDLRIWYAEGRARPGVLLPPITVRAVLVLHHSEAIAEPGRSHLHHQADLFLYIDSKTAALVARLMGPSAPRMAEQCVVQLQYFFSGLTRYLDRHPERTEVLLFGRIPPVTRGAAAVASE